MFFLIYLNYFKIYLVYIIHHFLILKLVSNNMLFVYICMIYLRYYLINILFLIFRLQDYFISNFLYFYNYLMSYSILYK